MKLAKPFNVKQAIEALSGKGSDTSAQDIAGVLRDMYTALQSNLTLGDNIIAQFSTVPVNTSSTYSGGNFQPIVVPWVYADKKNPQSVLVGQVINPSNQAKLTGSQSVQWTYDSTRSVINISYISGLNNSGRYTVTLEIK